MNISTTQLTKLTASEGMLLTNGEVYSNEVYLGIYDSPENWHEVPEDTPIPEDAPVIITEAPDINISLLPLEINCGTINFLPITKYDSRITKEMQMKPNDYAAGTNDAIDGNLNAVIVDGAVTIQGKLLKETTLTIWLQEVQH